MGLHSSSWVYIQVGCQMQSINQRIYKAPYVAKKSEVNYRAKVSTQ